MYKCFGSCWNGVVAEEVGMGASVMHGGMVGGLG